MILLTLAAAVLAQWTGPRTVEYVGPGNFCGGGYAVSLAPGDRALVLPQLTGGQGVRFVIGGREVNVHSGVRPQGGPIVKRYLGSVVTQANDGGGVSYVVADDTSFALAVTSAAFRGYKNDRWFFNHANFADRADDAVNCLAGRSF